MLGYTRIELVQEELTVSELEFLAKACGVSLKAVSPDPLPALNDDRQPHHGVAVGRLA